MIPHNPNSLWKRLGKAAIAWALLLLLAGGLPSSLWAQSSGMKSDPSDVLERNLDPTTRMNLMSLDGPVFKPLPEDDLRVGASASIVGNHKYAIKRLTEAIDSGGLPLDKLSQAYTSRGISKARSNHLAEAVYDFAKALEADPSNAPAHYYLGETLRNLGLFTEAVVALNQAVALKPNYAKAYYLRGTVWMLKGENKLAADDFSLAIKHDPSIADAYYMRAEALEKMGLYKRALADLKTFQVHNPLDLSVALMIEELQKRLGRGGNPS
ncbi:MAG: tetratricopeptide repeat protein [Desulfarculaceae bacterium]|nr:tetratricopeptide repeat protein [Desulfarculaceae bacterium]